jgi:hypothetical protein
VTYEKIAEEGGGILAFTRIFSAALALICPTKAGAEAR